MKSSLAWFNVCTDTFLRFYPFVQPFPRFLLSGSFLYHFPSTLLWPAHANFSGGHQSSAGRSSSPLWYQLPYDVSAYIRDISSRFEKSRFQMSLQSESALSGLLCLELYDTSAGAWHKSSNHRSWFLVSTLEKLWGKMDTYFACCWEQDKYLQRLLALLSEVFRRCSVPSVVVTDRLCISEDLESF